MKRLFALGGGLAAIIAMTVAVATVIIIGVVIVSMGASQESPASPRFCLNQGAEMASDAAEANVPAEYVSLVKESANSFGISFPLMSGLIQQESQWNPDAVSSAGAQGLTQLMPETARQLGVTDPFDPAQSIEGGSRYLADMLDRFNGSIELALAAYNAGPNAVEKHDDIPPIQETQDYVPAVLDYAQQFGDGSRCVTANYPEGKPGPWGNFENGKIPLEALEPISTGHYLRPDAAEAFLAMSEAYEQEFGRPIGITDSYRDYPSQVLCKLRKGSLCAEPGTSIHGWGLAVDLVYGSWDSATMRWLQVNAGKYGWFHPSWAQRDGSKPEPWHWEYGQPY